eukprot:CAMPEP_0172598816 /NCGR_PEP_ID=MMETSP1068-20121228/18875_1 /TAXON_ID=35684 /ORGANISM="Pseudopedinella elastica, Strain CCMP716" /LENGTH=745 /DNA_ID=CAMNT_0013398835 /DNA_START=57 /DNA_END=2294 /DNA_ORIENTATION=-
MARLSALVFALMTQAAYAKTASFSTDDSSDRSVTSMTLTSRIYVPFDKTNFGFGMGAAEQIAYDPVEKKVYAVSEQKYVNIMDYSVDPAAPTLWGTIDLSAAGGSLTDVLVCEGNFYVSQSAATKTDPGSVLQFPVATGTSGTISATPLKTFTVGALPDMIEANSDCTKIAVANEGEGSFSSTTNVLTDPSGSVSIITLSDGSVKTVTFESVVTSFTDAALLALGVHLPLPEAARTHFSLGLGTQTYSPAMNLEPEYLAWSADDSALYVGLQENSAIVKIDAATSTAKGIFPLGDKDWSATGIDVLEDDACTVATITGFKTMRMPDSIAAVEVDGKTYVLTANEGDDVEQGSYEQKQKFKDIVTTSADTSTNTAVGAALKGDANGWSASLSSFTQLSYFKTNQKSMRVSIGSPEVDYTTSPPTLKEVVGFGGRGISIYKGSDMDVTSAAMTPLWDSGSAFETTVCSAVPWAHNGVCDEEFSGVPSTVPAGASTTETAEWTALWTSDTGIQSTLTDMSDPTVDGCTDQGNGSPGACPLGKTKDERSAKDGPAAEAIVAGVACGRLFAVTATEKQGVAIVYDITSIDAPVFKFAMSLTPAQEALSASLAYKARSMGDVDPESMVFLEAADSPTGYAGIMFGGAWSGTVSFYEFKDADGEKCAEPPSWDDDYVDPDSKWMPWVFGLIFTFAVLGIIAYFQMKPNEEGAKSAVENCAKGTSLDFVSVAPEGESKPSVVTVAPANKVESV